MSTPKPDVLAIRILSGSLKIGCRKATGRI
jgi:hypothetical protein